MSDKFQDFLRALRSKFSPDYVLSVRPYRCVDDETITHWVNILMVPTEKLHDVTWDAWGLAEEIYGDEPTQFLMTSVNPESSEKYFAEALGRAGSERATPKPAFPVVTVAQRDVLPDWLRVGDYLAMCASLAAPYRFTLDWNETVVSRPVVDAPSTWMDCDLGQEGSTIRPEDPLEVNYPRAA